MRKTKSSDEPSVETVYQKKSQLEHILLRPDTYIGSVNRVEDKMWVYENEKFIFKNISYVPGLYKIFDEILVNACDNIQRDSSMNQIKVDINKSENKISIFLRKFLNSGITNLLWNGGSI